MVCVDNRIIQTIGRHVIAKYTLTSGNQCICIDESAQFGIIITGLEVVERGLSVLGLTAMPIRNFLCPHEITWISCGCRVY